MLMNCDELPPHQVYAAMIQAIIPRPIAWVLSDNGNGSFNLAPFSFFTGVTSDPPLLLISVGLKPDGTRKDTWVNIEARGEFVAHIVPRELAAPMVASSATLPHGESEVTALGLATIAEPGFRLPRLAMPRVALFCRRYAIHEVGRGPQGLILGRIHGIFIDDAIVGRAGDRLVIDARHLDPLARLGGSEYAALGEVFSLVRPK